MSDLVTHKMSQRCAQILSKGYGKEYYEYKKIGKNKKYNYKNYNSSNRYPYKNRPTKMEMDGLVSKRRYKEKGRHHRRWGDEIKLTAGPHWRRVVENIGKC